MVGTDRTNLCLHPPWAAVAAPLYTDLQLPTKLCQGLKASFTNPHLSIVFCQLFAFVDVTINLRG